MGKIKEIIQNLIQKLAIIYVRVSSADQLSGTSLEVQERVCREWADRQGIKVAKVFIERGESAKTTDRTEFTKALAFCADKKNKISHFVVYKLDRFARNQDDHVMVRALLKRAGVELRSAKNFLTNFLMAVFGNKSDSLGLSHQGRSF